MINRKKLAAVAAVLLAMALLCLPAAAANRGTEERAERLASLHLLRGTGVRADGSIVYDLDKEPSRLQGLIMLVRLLGAEETALSGSRETPFTDVSDSTAGYVAYAYRKGITNGTSATTFTPNLPLTPRACLTFLLRALGYSEEAGDFAWGGQAKLAVSLGLITQRAAGTMESASLTRGDLVDLCYAALTCTVKGGRQTLAEKLLAGGVFTAAQGEAAQVLGSGAGWTYDAAPEGPAVAYEKRTFTTSAGSITAHVLTVNTADPAVTVKTAMVDNTLNHTAPFSRIVQESGGAAAVINGNFFSSYSAFKAPIGHVMADGEFLYANSGLSSLGIGEDGTLQVGRPPVFVRLTSGGSDWSVYEINTADQTSTTSVMYTPAYGEKCTMAVDGWALRAEGGRITEFYSASAGASITIPRDGYVVYMGTGYASTSYFRIPQIGSAISMEYYLSGEDEEGFRLEGVEQIISGAPRLVRNGKIVTTLEPGFQEARFTTQSAPRTAAGIDGAGRLILVCVPGGATIQQLREFMLSAGCVEALNLDGGASCGMYYQGAYLATPSRELTVTLQVFVDG